MENLLLTRFLQAEGKSCSLTPDYVIINDALSIDAVDQLMTLTPKIPEKVIVFIDHDTPNSSIEVGEIQRKLINWAIEKKTCLEKCQGVGYLRLLETYIEPGQIIVGTGSHMAGLGAVGALGLTVDVSSLFKALCEGVYEMPCPNTAAISLEGVLNNHVTMQDAGLVLCNWAKKNHLENKLVIFRERADLTVAERFDLCHFMEQAGVVSALFADSSLLSQKSFFLNQVEAVIALPGEPSQLETLSGRPQFPINEVFIGGCRGGKIEDLRAAAKVLKGKSVSSALHVIVAPATSSVYLQAIEEGLIDIFLDSGAVVMNQGCSVCWGKAQGILDAGEVLVSTGSYQYPGCSGDKDAAVYLVSPAIAAQCAIAGRL